MPNSTNYMRKKKKYVREAGTKSEKKMTRKRREEKNATKNCIMFSYVLE